MCVDLSACRTPVFCIVEFVQGTRVDDEGPRRARERGGDLAPIRVLTNEDSGRSGVVGQTLSFTT
jgi:hypothetical protein